MNDKCELCGEPMPEGEEMFKIHGYSGNCPKPPLPRTTPDFAAFGAEVAAILREYDHRPRKSERLNLIYEAAAKHGIALGEKP